MIETIKRWRAGYQGMRNKARATLLWALLVRQRRWLKWMIGMLVLSIVFRLMIAQLSVALVDRGIVDQTAPLWPFVPRMAVLGLFTAGCSFAVSMLTQRISYQIEFDARVWLYTRIQSAELQKLDALKGGQLVTRALTDLHLMERLLAIFPLIIGLAPVMLALGLLVFILSPYMGLVAILAMPINLWLLRLFRERLWGLSWAELNERAEVASAIDEPVRGIRVVRAFGRAEHERGRVATTALKTYRYGITRIRLLARYDFLMKLVPFTVQAGVLAIGAHLVASGNLTLGTFLLAFQVTTGMSQMASAFDNLAQAWQYLRSAQGRLAEMMALGTAPTTEGRELGPLSTGLEARGITVELGGRKVLDRLDVVAAPGELVVVAGPPSSGKSVLASVIAGVREPDAGAISLDGTPIEDLDPFALRLGVRVVSEESMLFKATLRENLVLGAVGVDIDDSALERALWAAAADDVVASVEGGLDGEIGDRGLTLSGGQRQRLALARALVLPPRILVLDDALASVNPSLEVEILRRIRVHAPDTAVVVITRRTGIARVGDRAVELKAPPRAREALLEEIEEHTAPVGSTGVVDLNLANIITNLKLTDETPPAPDDLVASADPPRLARLARPFAGVAVLAAVFLLLQSAGKLSPEALFGAIADVVEEGTREADVRALILFGIGFLYAGSSYFFRVFVQRFTQGIVYLMRRRVFHRLSLLGIDFYDREQPGTVAARVVHDLDKVSEFLESHAFLMLIAIGQFVVGMGIVVALSPGTAPVVAAMAAAIIIVTAIQLPIANRAFNWARDEMGHVAGKFEEDFLARQEIRNLGAGGVQTGKFVDASWQRRRARWWVALVSIAWSSAIQYIGIVGSAFVLWRGGDLVLAGTLTIGTALSLRLLSETATLPLSSVGEHYRIFLEARVAWRRLQQPFEVPILPVERPGAQQCPPLAGEVVFDGVQFAYPHTGRTVLHDVSLRLEPGTVTVMVGYTGAGKSSIAKLLSRMYDPDAGAVRVDGIDVRDLDLDSYRQRLGIVPQDAFLFKGTVASNIAYGTPGAGREDIEDAARAVGAWPLLSRLPGGLDHPVEEEARNLTAAQRQLIAIARAWRYRPDILVLLQPTSPFRRAAHIDAAIDLLSASGADSVVSVVPVPHQFTPSSLMQLQGDRLVPYAADGATRRQDKPLLFARNGPAVVAVRTRVVTDGHVLYGPDTRGLVMPRQESFDIDDAFDLEVAERLMASRA